MATALLSNARPQTRGQALALGSHKTMGETNTQTCNAEELLRELLQDLGAVIWEADLGTWQVSSVSGWVEELLGYPVEEWLVDPHFWAHRLHPADFASVIAEFTAAVKDGHPRRFECRMLTKEGRALWFQCNVRAMGKAAQQCKALRGVLVDITERKEAERKLRERTAYLHGLLENNPLGIVVLDPEHRVQMCNRAFTQLFQYRQAEIVGRHLDSLLAPAELLEEAARLTRQASAGEMAHAVTRRKREDGSLVDVEIHAVPLTVEGCVVGCFGLYQNITDRKRAEQEIEKHSVYLKALIESSPLALVAYDGQGRVQMCNPAFERLFQYRAAEVVGRKLDELIANDDLRADAAQSTARVLAGETIHAIARRMRKDGTVVNVERYSVPLWLEGQIVGGYAFYQEATEHRRAEELKAQLGELQRMEAVGQPSPE